MKQKPEQPGRTSCPAWLSRSLSEDKRPHLELKYFMDEEVEGERVLYKIPEVVPSQGAGWGYRQAEKGSSQREQCQECCSRGHYQAASLQVCHWRQSVGSELPQVS